MSKSTFSLAPASFPLRPSVYEMEFPRGVRDNRNQPFISYRCPADNMSAAWARAKGLMAALGIDPKAAKPVSFRRLGYWQVLGATAGGRGSIYPTVPKPKLIKGRFVVINED